MKAEPKRLLLMVYKLDIGGTERQLTEIARNLDPERFEVHVACLHAEGLRAGELRAAGIRVVTFPMASFFSFQAARQAIALIRYIRHTRIDLVHAFDVPMDVYGVPVAVAARRPVVLSSQRAHRELTPGLYHRLLRLTDHIVDGIVVNCEHMRRHLTEDERVPSRLIHLCYNGLDTRFFYPAESPPLREKIVVGVVCALRPEKGLSTLLDAFARLDPHRVELLIVGSGPSLPALETQAATLGITARCRFVPSTEHVAEWLHGIDIFVLPSLSEALSNSLMEAMACGCCVAASRVGGNAELAGEDGERGLLFETGNVAKLAEILTILCNDPARRERMSAAAAKFIREAFSIEASVARMSAIYDEFLSR